MKTYGHFHSVRLATAGAVSLFLLLWVAVFDDSVASIFTSVRDGRSGSPLRILLTAMISLFILAILFPVLWRGPKRDRWLAGLLTVFPLFVFVVTALWV